MEKTDRYGFYICDDKHTGSVVPERERQRRVDKEGERTRKWLRMMREWDHFNTRKYDVLQRRIRKGVPDALRMEIWGRLSGMQMLKSASQGEYERLTAITREMSQDAEIWDTIERDIDRTFPRHRMFSRANLDGQNALRHVLHAYAEQDPEIGYCQGMAFIAAMLLSYMVEEDAYWCLVAVMTSKKHDLRRIYQSGFARLQEQLTAIDELAKQHLPRLWQHLHAQNVSPSMYATQWLLTVFTNSFPFDLVTRVWDVFFAEGWKVVYRVSLAILKLAEPELRNRDFEGIMMFMRDYPMTLDAEAVMQTAFKLKLKTSHIDAALAAHDPDNPR